MEEDAGDRSGRGQDVRNRGGWRAAQGGGKLKDDLERSID